MTESNGERKPAKDIGVGDLVLTGQHVWRVTQIGSPIGWDKHGMFLIHVASHDGGPPRHKPLHVYPLSEYRVVAAPAGASS